MPEVPPFKIHITVENEAKDKAVRIPVVWDGNEFSVTPTFEPAASGREIKKNPVESLYIKFASDIVAMLMKE